MASCLNTLVTLLGKLLLIWFKLAAFTVLGFIALIFALTWKSGR